MAELSEAKQNARRLWGEVGDFGKVAEMLLGAGETAVAAGGVGSGDKVLDVACGTGNAAWIGALYAAGAALLVRRDVE